MPNNIDENLLVATTLCSRLIKQDDLKYLSFALWHRLISELYNHGVSNPSVLLGRDEKTLASYGFTNDFCKRLLRLLDTAYDVEKKLNEYADCGINVMGLDNPDYPEKVLQRLKNLSPPVIFCVGNTKLLNTDSVSVVGARKPSYAGKIFANKLGKLIAKEGYTLVSGGADGCDCISEYSATNVGGNAVLYLAVPLKKRMKNARIAELMLQNRVCLVSDHCPTGAFHAGYALSRNKYIYSASIGAVVCESGAEKGGSYNGALSCINDRYGRVLVYDNKQCYGNQMLILKGGLGVESAVNALSVIDDIKGKKIDDIK